MLSIGSRVVVTFGLLLGVAAASAGADDEFYYSYFDQHRPLALNTAEIAVQVADWPGPDDIAQRLERAGVAVEGVTPRAVPGWAVANLNVQRSADEMLGLTSTLAASGDYAFVSPVFVGTRGRPLLITPDLLIGFAESVGADEAEALLVQHEAGEIVERSFADLPNVYRVRSASHNGFEVLSLANALADLPEVVFCESDMLMQAELHYVPNDPLFPQQWALDQGNDQDMDAPEAWDVTTGDPGIVVVVMDSGIQQDHPDIHQIPGQDFTGNGTPGGGPYNNCDNHGTTVAGCISAVIDNGLGVVGVAPTCTVTSAKMGTTLEFLGFCLPFIDAQPSYVADALAWTVNQGYHVTNSSFGFDVNSTMTVAYNNAKANGVISFASTGNDGTGSLAFPASLDSVVAVGALSSSGNRASFSQYGAGIAFCAPGEGILTTDRTGSAGYESGDTATVDGTSFSSPYAAGVAALVLSQDSTLTPDEVEQVMNETCVDRGPAGYDVEYGWGFVNAHNAVQAVTAAYGLGDLNCDGAVDFDDINPFVLALTSGPDYAAYYAVYPDCNPLLADANQDGVIDFDDINPFVALLSE